MDMVLPRERWNNSKRPSLTQQGQELIVLTVLRRPAAIVDMDGPTIALTCHAKFGPVFLLAILRPEDYLEEVLHAHTIDRRPHLVDLLPGFLVSLPGVYMQMFFMSTTKRTLDSVFTKRKRCD